MYVLLGAIFLIVACLTVFLSLRKPYHIYSLVICRDYNNVWDALSDPLKYKELYPHWVKEISAIDSNTYKVEDQFKNTYDMLVLLNKQTGAIDLEIGQEKSSLRIFPLLDNATIIVHFAKPWGKISLRKWISHKKTIKDDFLNAKRRIENS